MLAKLLDARDVYEVKGAEAALSYLARLPKVCGGEKDAVSKGAAALANPGFYREIGSDPTALVASGLAAVRRLIYPPTEESPMTATETAPVVAAPKAPKAAKTPAPKAKTVAKPAPKAKAETNGKAGVTGVKLAVLKHLAKKGPSTRSELAKALDTFVGADIMGHFDETKRKPNSLMSLGLVRYAASKNEDGTAYDVTAAGRKVAAG